MTRHAEDRGKRGDAQPADAGHEDIVAVRAHGWQRGLRQLALLVRNRRTPLRLAAVDRDEARAKSLNAGEILVASGLFDLAFSPEFRLKRLYGETVGGAGAVAATFANTCVNNGPGRRLFQGSALAAAAFFGRANLIVDDDADAGRTTQLALYRVQPRAGMKRRSRRDIGVSAIAARIVADDGDARNTLGPHLGCDPRHGKRPVDGLSAGHGHGVVIEDLVGHAVAGSDGLADGEGAGVVIGAVAQVGEDVRLARKRRLARP